MLGRGSDSGLRTLNKGWVGLPEFLGPAGPLILPVSSLHGPGPPDPLLTTMEFDLAAGELLGSNLKDRGPASNPGIIPCTCANPRDFSPQPSTPPPRSPRRQARCETPSTAPPKFRASQSQEQLIT